jgi:hypothetical protein
MYTATTVGIHRSIFSFNLTRPYPFRWFSPLVFVGGSVVIVLVTFLSVATSGYETVSVYSANPNDTEAQQTYFSKWPSFLSANTKSTCVSTTVPVSSNFYTNNTAFTYTLSTIQQGPAADSQQIVGSLPYHNNKLQNCSVVSIAMTLESMERTTAQIARQEWGASLEAFITCLVDGQEGLTTVNLTTTWDFEPAGIMYTTSGEQFIGVNESYSSLWWGQSMMAWYYTEFVGNVENAVESVDGNSIYKGYIIMDRSDGPPTDEEEIKSLDFFHPKCYYAPFSSNGGISISWCKDMNLSELIHSDDSSVLPGIWSNADALSKAMYYTILADLGQSDDSHPSILTSTDLLEYFTRNFSQISQSAFDNNLKSALLAQGPFTAENASRWHLDVWPAFISTEYLCQQPRLKQGGSLIMVVVVADLVLLQAIWTVFKFGIDFFLQRKYPEINNCDRCQSRAEDEIQILSSALRAPSSSNDDQGRGYTKLA